MWLVAGESSLRGAPCLLILLGCQSSTPGGDGRVDAAEPGCVVGLAECDNCIDDDGDGAIDGLDFHCLTAWDDDERTVGFGIPDFRLAEYADCFFDGNTGSGDDGCSRHVCCTLGAADQSECSDLADAHGFAISEFDPESCSVSAGCAEFCAPLAPPGCDCFGCCTRCDSSGCFDVWLHEGVSRGCGPDSIGDPSTCIACVKSPECVSLCDGAPVCQTSSDCQPGQYCAQGCCVGVE